LSTLYIGAVIRQTHCRLLDEAEVENVAQGILEHKRMLRVRTTACVEQLVVAYRSATRNLWRAAKEGSRSTVKLQARPNSGAAAAWI